MFFFISFHTVTFLSFVTLNVLKYCTCRYLFLIAHLQILQFQVIETTFVSDPISNSSTNGWIIHWCHKPDNLFPSLNNLNFDQSFVLSIDKVSTFFLVSYDIILMT